MSQYSDSIDKHMSHYPDSLDKHVSQHKYSLDKRMSQNPDSLDKHVSLCPDYLDKHVSQYTNSQISRANPLSTGTDLFKALSWSRQFLHASKSSLLLKLRLIKVASRLSPFISLISDLDE